MNCEHCKSQIAPGATNCSVCGAAVQPQQACTQQPYGQAPVQPAATKSSVLALILSCFICGAGQMYCGQVGKGLVMLGAMFFMWLMHILFLFIFVPLCFLSGIVIFAVWICNLIDAFRIAEKINQGKVVGGFEFF